MKIARFAIAFLCISMSASAQGIDVKTPASLPHVDDVKTPAPPQLMGPGLPLSLPAASTSIPAHPSQRVLASASAASRHGIDHVFTSTSEGGTIWARGRTYKARFDASGATFVPFFGATAPRNYPVQFSTSSVSVGSTALELGAIAPVESDDTIELDRGSFVERWQLGVEGMEQQFVFASLPAAGDLVIRVSAETELAISRVDGAVAFGNELGRVDYGAATAVDAHDRRFPMKSTLVDGVIELRLDRSDVAQAILPLVVDPFVSVFPLGDYGTQDVLPDVAYDVTSDRYLVVYEDTYSGTDHDIYLELRDTTGALVTFDFIDYTTDYWAAPRVASNRIADDFLCVAAVGIPGTFRTISGRTFDPTTSTLGAQFSIAGADGYDKHSPDVGGDPSTISPTYFMVVWQRDYSATDLDIHGRLVASNGTLIGTSTILIDNTGGTYDDRPSISKTDGHDPYATQDWTVVWQRYSNQWSQYQIFAAQVHWDGGITHATYPIDATSDNVLNPRVSSILDGDGVTRPYMVVFQALNQTATDWDVLGLMFVNTTFLVGTSIPNQVSYATLAQDQIEPCVDSDGRQFTALYSQKVPFTSNDYDVIAADVVYAGGYPYVCDSAALPTSPDSDVGSSITSTYSGGGAPQRYLAVWESANFQFGTADVKGALYDGLPGGCAMPFCFGDGTGTACPCGNSGASGNGCANSIDPNGGNLTYAGNPQVSADTFVLHASGLPHGGTGLYFQGVFPAGGYYGATFGDGIRCITSSIRRIGAKSNPSGSSQYPEAVDPSISVKGVIPAAGTETFYQLWYRNAGAFCTPSPFNLTNGLAVVWAP